MKRVSGLFKIEWDKVDKAEVLNSSDTHITFKDGREDILTDTRKHWLPLPPQRYTTVCVDIYGRVYDLMDEHPSWEAEKNGQDRCIVRDAFMWPVEKLEELRKRESKSKKNKRKA